jgi:hypothetical protein
MRFAEVSARSVCILALLASTQLIALQDPAEPSARDQAVMLARVRREALRYQRELPDFICLQVTTRSVDETGTGQHWRKLDRFEVEDSYVGKFVNHKLIMLNGKPPRKNYQQLNGFLSESVLHSVGFLPGWLFSAQAKTEFEWVRSDAINGRPVQVFKVHLAPADSKFTISTERRSAVAGIDGFIYVDSMAATVRRFEIQMILPPDAAIQDGAVDIDYDAVSISERQFLLPVKFVVRASFGGTLGRNETQVVRYQKYAADTTIHFDEPSLEGAIEGATP